LGLGSLLVNMALLGGEVGDTTKCNGWVWARPQVVTRGGRVGATVERNGAAVKQSSAAVKRNGVGVERVGAAVKQSSGAVKRNGVGVERVGAAVERDGMAVERNGVAVKRNGRGKDTDKDRGQGYGKDRGQGQGTRTEDKDRGQGRGDSAGKDTDKDRGQGRGDCVNKLMRMNLWRAAALVIYRNLTSAHTRNTHEQTPTRANTGTSKHRHEQTPTPAKPHSLIPALPFPHLGTSHFLIPALRRAAFRHFVALHSLASVTAACGLAP